MKKNKRVIIIITIILLIVLNIFLVLKKDNNIIEKSKLIKVERKEFNIYKEQTTGKKDYVSVSDTTFPTSGYLLNTTKSVCKSYNDQNITPIPVTQELTKGSINGLITVNSNKTIYCDLYFDKDDKPSISNYTIIGKTSGNQNLTNGFTYNNTVTYKIDWQDSDVVSYCINDTTSCSNWIELTDKSVKTISVSNNTYTSSNGVSKNVSVYIKDKAGNISAVQTKSITVDRTIPSVTLALKGTNETGQTLSNSETYTHTKNITYTASITEANMESNCIGETSCNLVSSTTKTFTNTAFTLSDTEGEKTVIIKVKDKAGNEASISKKITLDKTNPTATISEKTHDTESITVTVGYTGTEALIGRQCKINNQSTWKDTGTNGDCTINSLDDGTKLKDGTEYTIEGRVRDASGRWNTIYPNVKVTTQFGYTCDNVGGDLVFDEQKGWICKSNGKSSLVTRWTCSVDTSKKYESEALAREACTGEKKGTCSQVASYSCPQGGEVSGTKCVTKGLCELSGYQTWWKCSLLTDLYDKKSSCEVFCKSSTPAVEETKFWCDVLGEDYSSLNQCESGCVGTGQLGSVENYNETLYNCESGWKEFSGSGTSNLVCYKEALLKH